MQIFKIIFIISMLSIFNISCSEKVSPASGIWLNHDRRTAGTVIDDQAICIKANLALAKDKTLWKTSHISTLSYNNTLLLVGQTSSIEAKQRIAAIINPIPEVEHIYNQLTIAKPISIKQRARDSFITAQVKAKIMSNRDIGINRIKVITEDNVVYLMGKLTLDEENIATELTRNIKGVSEVVKIFERFG